MLIDAMFARDMHQVYEINDDWMIDKNDDLAISGRMTSSISGPLTSTIGFPIGSEVIRDIWDVSEVATVGVDHVVPC